MLNQFRPALVIVVVLTLITGLAYPLAVTGIASALFPAKAGGSLIERNGRIVGSALIGQDFDKARYFHGRPSATTGPDPKDTSKSILVPYNAENSGGSNLGPTNKALIERIRQDVANLQKENPGVPVPPDLVTTSASGLDPDISLEAALFQVPRVAKARGIPADKLRELVTQHVEGRIFNLFGEPHVNVLRLNLDLDGLPKA